MIRANIYSIDALDSERYDAIESGLDLLGGYIGETVASRALRIRLPEDLGGRVNPDRVGVSQLDQEVALHVMAVPLANNLMRGTAFSGSGVSFINSLKAKSTIEATAAHEGAHSLGFLRPDAPQQDVRSEAHCSSPGCVMCNRADSSAVIVAGGSSVQRQPMASGKLDELLAGPFSSIRSYAAKELPIGNDFCSPCQSELKQFGQEHLYFMKMARMAAGRVSFEAPAGLA